MLAKRYPPPQKLNARDLDHIRNLKAICKNIINIMRINHKTYKVYKITKGVFISNP